MAKLLLQVFDTCTDYPDIDQDGIQHPLLTELASLPREFDVKMVGVGIQTMVGARARVFDGPNLTIPYDVINTDRARSRNDGPKQLISQRLLIWILGTEMDVQSPPLSM